MTLDPSGDDDWPGRRLGAPPTGAGSLARVGRRLAAIAVDWAASMLVSAAFFDGDPWATLAVFTVEQVLLVATLGAGFGHRLLGLRVVLLAPPGRPPGWGPALVRGLLLGLALPALIWDRDSRGLHDRFAGTLLVRR
ncbi:RDD family protein [Quadrisphaera sp. DSM 44207]|uniref:RDD family protein n=1 Tax=Quadrisphaera sp. DSM 44207 TaxID=1881057 RepID=UPI0008899A24|nr:RDD family protein [Quadrisphaera sp. DSM 44207]SDQ03914.1 RDD family protein [Quadrisphaera sp. DSM 44207]